MAFLNANWQNSFWLPSRSDKTNENLFYSKLKKVLPFTCKLLFNAV